jgi:3'5'-cyclic nucleotide phosphodiesterase
VLTIRSCYQPENHYHNFRHAVDVLQAAFQILESSNLIPPIPSPSTSPSPTTTDKFPPRLPAGYVTPVEVLAICISAIGHDAGHPGVTNTFLTASRSSLSLVFNERSVLENLHCLTICRILEDRWPSLLRNDRNSRIRKLILDMILSTDMAFHFEYMSKFESLRNSALAFPDVDESQRRLVCCNILKSSDISNLV